MPLRERFSEVWRAKFLKEFHTGSPKFHAGFGEEFHLGLRELIVIVNSMKMHVEKYGKNNLARRALK